jgi:hypothetical protein
MKTIRIIPLLLALVMGSCASVEVANDFDRNVDYSQYKTFGFYKSGVDKVEISDLDKKRILHAIEDQMIAKGFVKSDKPDLLVNIFTKSRQQIDVNQFNAGWGYGWGFGWNPWGFGGRTSVSTSTEGTLFIDLIDAKKKELVWQGEGIGTLTKNSAKKEERIKDFVAKILAQYPPETKNKK